jgi:LytS/YehU family sensor histidine kinase
MLKPEQDGWVKISIKSSNESIKCTIEDNGVGRKKAQSIRSKQEVERKSLGFRITAQRIELLNSLYKDKFSIIYTDLYTPNGEPIGTRVELLIPYSVNQESNNQ